MQFSTCWILNELSGPDDDTVPEHGHGDVPQHKHDVPLHFHLEDEDGSSEEDNENPDGKGESPESPGGPGSGDTSQIGGRTIDSCPTEPYTF